MLQCSILHRNMTVRCSMTGSAERVVHHANRQQGNGLKTMTTKSNSTGKAAPGGNTRWNGTLSFETIAEESRASFDSVVEASTIAAKGYGAIGSAWFDFAKEAMAAQAGAAEALMGARSWAELSEAQSGHAKTAFERTLAAGKRIADMSVKTAGDAMAPLRARTEDIVERYGKPAF